MVFQQNNRKPHTPSNCQQLVSTTAAYPSQQSILHALSQSQVAAARPSVIQYFTPQSGYTPANSSFETCGLAAAPRFVVNRGQPMYPQNTQQFIRLHGDAGHSAALRHGRQLNANIAPVEQQQSIPYAPIGMNAQGIQQQQAAARSVIQQQQAQGSRSRTASAAARATNLAMPNGIPQTATPVLLARSSGATNIYAPQQLRYLPQQQQSMMPQLPQQQQQQQYMVPQLPQQQQSMMPQLPQQQQYNMTTCQDPRSLSHLAYKAPNSNILPSLVTSGVGGANSNANVVQQQMLSRSTLSFSAVENEARRRFMSGGERTAPQQPSLSVSGGMINTAENPDFKYSLNSKINRRISTQHTDDKKEDEPQQNGVYQSKQVMLSPRRTPVAPHIQSNHIMPAGPSDAFVDSYATAEEFESARTMGGGAVDGYLVGHFKEQYMNQTQTRSGYRHQPGGTTKLQVAVTASSAFTADFGGRSESSCSPQECSASNSQYSGTSKGDAIESGPATSDSTEKSYDSERSHNAVQSPFDSELSFTPNAFSCSVKSGEDERTSGRTASSNVGPNDESSVSVFACSPHQMESRSTDAIPCARTLPQSCNSSTAQPKIHRRVNELDSNDYKTHVMRSREDSYYATIAANYMDQYDDRKQQNPELISTSTAKNMDSLQGRISNKHKLLLSSSFSSSPYDPMSQSRDTNPTGGISASLSRSWCNTTALRNEPVSSCEDEYTSPSSSESALQARTSYFSFGFRPGTAESSTPATATAAVHADRRPAAVHADNRPAAVHADSRPAAVHADSRPAAVHADNRPAAVHADNRPAAVHADSRPAAVHADSRPAAVHADSRPAAVHADRRPAAVHADRRPAAVHADNRPAAVHADRLHSSPSSDGSTSLLYVAQGHSSKYATPREEVATRRSRQKSNECVHLAVRGRNARASLAAVNRQPKEETSQHIPGNRAVLQGAVPRLPPGSMKDAGRSPRSTRWQEVEHTQHMGLETRVDASHDLNGFRENASRLLSKSVNQLEQLHSHTSRKDVVTNVSSDDDNTLGRWADANNGKWTPAENCDNGEEVWGYSGDDMTARGRPYTGDRSSRRARSLGVVHKDESPSTLVLSTEHLGSTSSEESPSDAVHNDDVEGEGIQKSFRKSDKEQDFELCRELQVTTKEIATADVALGAHPRPLSDARSSTRSSRASEPMNFDEFKISSIFTQQNLGLLSVADSSAALYEAALDRMADEAYPPHASQLTPGRGHPPINKEITDTGEAFGTENIYKCASCSRTFGNKTAYSKHSAVCLKVFCAKSPKVRSGTPKAEPAQLIAPPKRSWRLESMRFRAMMRGQTPPISVNADASLAGEYTPQRGRQNGPASPLVLYTESYSCPHCGRTFNEEAQKRHVAVCKSVFRKSGGWLKKGGGTLAANREALEAAAAATTATATAERNVKSATKRGSRVSGLKSPVVRRR